MSLELDACDSQTVFSHSGAHVCDSATLLGGGRAGAGPRRSAVKPVSFSRYPQNCDGGCQQNNNFRSVSSIWKMILRAKETRLELLVFIYFFKLMVCERCGKLFTMFNILPGFMSHLESLSNLWRPRGN